ncbi:MAG: TolC family protein [Oligoflexia bacterium]|nr:TolC family protein [Oligoflexia bacterium]
MNRIVLSFLFFLSGLTIFTLLTPTSFAKHYNNNNNSGKNSDKIEIKWESLGTNFLEYYKNISASGLSEKKANLVELTNMFHWDPVLSGRTGYLNNFHELQMVEGQLAQKSPWGTEANIKLSRDYINNQKNLSFTLSQELLKDGPWWGNTLSNQAEATKKRSILNAEIEFTTKFFQTLRAYLNFQNALYKEEAFKLQLENTKEELVLTNELIKSGLRSASDALVVKTKLVKLSLNFEQQIQIREEKRQELAVILGFKENDFIAIKEEWPLDIIERLENYVNPQNNIEIAEAKSLVEVSKANVLSSTRNSLPNLTASITKNKELIEQNTSTVYLLTMSLPFTTSIERYSQKLAQMELQQSERALFEKEQDFLRMINGFRGRIKLAEKTIKMRKELLKIAKDTLEFEKKKYKGGLNTIFDIQTVDALVESAEIDLIDAQTNLLVEWLQYASSTHSLDKVFKLPL